MEFVLIWFICGVVSAVVASNKGRNGFGWFVLGMLFGPLGVILSFAVAANKQAVDTAAIRSGQSKKCPSCAELVKMEAIKCRYCGQDLSGPSPTEVTTGERTDNFF